MKLLLLAVLALTSCATTETTVTSPDGTVTRTITKSADPSALAAANAAVAIYATK